MLRGLRRRSVGSSVRVWPLAVLIGVALVLAPILGPVLTAFAAIKEWDGGSVVDNFWTTPENWSPNVVPSPGDDLFFSTAVQTTNNNLFPAGTLFRSLNFFNVFTVGG